MQATRVKQQACGAPESGSKHASHQSQAANVQGTRVKQQAHVAPEAKEQNAGHQSQAASMQARMQLPLPGITPAESTDCRQNRGNWRACAHSPPLHTVIAAAAAARVRTGGVHGGDAAGVPDAARGVCVSEATCRVPVAAGGLRVGGKRRAMKGWWIPMEGGYGRKVDTNGRWIWKEGGY
eukprot:364028-Chlamydomonas_euryale.AAC.4